MASLVGRLAVSVKDTAKPSRLDKFYRLGTFSRIFRNDYCTGVNPVSQLEEIDEDEINRIRDVSGLSDVLKAKVRGQLPPNLGERPYHFKKKYRQKLFCKFGRESELDPGSMWPSKEQMQIMIEEQAKYEISVDEMLAEVAKQKQHKEAVDKGR